MVERSQKNPELADALGGIPGPGDIIDGKYRIEGVLGSGGMGVVLSARHVTLGQFVAIKVLVVQSDHGEREAKARLLREARAAAALTSDHVVRIYDIGDDVGGRPFIVMERLFGVDLGQVLRGGGPLSVAEAASFVVQACRALGEAHALGIVHRDLKPSNLFLTRRSDGGSHIKVLDFGIAKSLDARELGQETLTGARVTLGSPSYMSPEQVRDARQVDGLTDIWSLGAILFELLTGKLAFHGNTLPGVCASIVADEPKVPSSLRGDIPGAVDAIVLRCLEKDKTRRFNDAGALAVALEPFAVPFVEFTEMVPFSWLPETVGSLHTITPATEPAPLMEAQPAIDSPRVFVPFHDRTLESGKNPNLFLRSSRRPRSGSRWFTGTPVLLTLVALIAVAIGVAVSLLWSPSRAEQAVARPGSNGPLVHAGSDSLAGTRAAGGHGVSSTSGLVEPRSSGSAPSGSSRGPVVAASKRAQGARTRPAPEGISSGDVPEIRMTR